MTRSSLSYAVVTPARNELANLSRLSAALATQNVLPVEWIVVDNGSSDGTQELVSALAAERDWVRLLVVPAAHDAARGAPIVRAFVVGVEALRDRPDVVVKLDADVSMDDNFFARFLDAFDDDPQLGICGGICLEPVDDAWAEPRVRGSHIRGAVRAYRSSCLADVSPLEERIGWDGIDAFKARSRGWRTTVVDVPFRHHRPLGARDAHPWRAQAARGEAAYYMGYRPLYLLARALYRSARQPAALAMIGGYAAAALRRAPRCSDHGVIREVRREQGIAALVRAARGRRLPPAVRG